MDMYDSSVGTSTGYIPGPRFLRSQSYGQVARRLSWIVKAGLRPGYTEWTDDIGSKLKIPLLLGRDVLVGFWVVELKVCWSDDEQAEGEEKFGDWSRSELTTTS